MLCTEAIPSGTVLWSVLLPRVRETGVTWSVLGKEGAVRHELPLRRVERGYDVRVRL
jgi:hypothetical protein